MADLTPTNTTPYDTCGGFRYRRTSSGQSYGQYERSLRLEAHNKAKAEREKRPAYFSKAEYARINEILETKALAGETWARDARISLKATIPSKRSGFVALAPSKYVARPLAASLRRINAFCLGLQRLDELAEAPTPEGRPVDFTPRELIEAITKIEATEGAAFDAVAVVSHLRRAGIYKAMARMFVTPETAAPIADALHAVSASRHHVLAFDSIAGRIGFRPL